MPAPHPKDARTQPKTGKLTQEGRHQKQGSCSSKDTSNQSGAQQQQGSCQKCRDHREGNRAKNMDMGEDQQQQPGTSKSRDASNIRDASTNWDACNSKDASRLNVPCNSTDTWNGREASSSPGASNRRDANNNTDTSNRRDVSRC
jgi:hypothetical protein